MNVRELKKFVKNYGALEVSEKVVESYKQNPEKLGTFSLRRAFEAFVCGDELTLEEGLDRAARSASGILGNPLLEETRRTAFSFITQNVLISKVLEGYNQTPGILDQLVTPLPSNMRKEKLVGFTAMAMPKDVEEGEEYDTVGITDRGTEGPEPTKRGMLMDITDEAIRFDRTGQLLARATAIGSRIALDREKRGILAVTDDSSSPSTRSFYPIVPSTLLPTQTDLYRTSGSAGTEWYNKTVNKIEGAGTALEDWTDIQALWNLAQEVTDEAGEKITIALNTLLVPYQILPTAAYIFGITSQGINTALAGAADTSNFKYNSFGPNMLNAMGLGSLRLLTSPHLTSSTAFWLGDFKQEFYEQIIIPTEVVTLPGNPRKDILLGYRARRKSRVYAADDKFVFMSKGAA